MKKLSLATLCILCGSLGAQSQGYFLFRNETAPTYLGSPNGPFADLGIWGQVLVGLTPDTLAPLGVPSEHWLGYVQGEDIAVPFANPDPMYGLGSVYAQMAAWDGRVWGTI